MEMPVNTAFRSRRHSSKKETAAIKRKLRGAQQAHNLFTMGGRADSSPMFCHMGVVLRVEKEPYYGGRVNKGKRRVTILF